MSRRGSPRIPTMPSGCSHGARWPKRCTPVTTGHRRGGAEAARDRAAGATAAQMGLRRGCRDAGGVHRRRRHRLGGARRRGRRSTFQSFTVDALDAHRLYVVEVRHPVEVPGSERTHLQAWLTKRCGWDVRAPELRAGLKLVGGRLLPGPTGPASFLMYESASGERFTIYTAKAEAEATQMRYSAQGNESALFWADRGVAYVVSGVGDRGRLTQIAQSVYDQMEKGGGLTRSNR